MPIGDAARHQVLCSDAPHRGHPVHSRIRLHRHVVTWGIAGHPGRDGRARPRVAPPDRRLLVATGDGEILIGLGALATIGVRRPQNLSIAVFDNRRYGETGMLASHTGAAVGLPAVACACGIEHAFDISNEPMPREFSTLVHSVRATLFARVAITADGTPRVLPPRDGALLKTRFSPRHWC